MTDRDAIMCRLIAQDADLIDIVKMSPPNGQHRRFFWRVRHRLGPRWWDIPAAEVGRLMRQYSWRRAL